MYQIRIIIVLASVLTGTLRGPMADAADELEKSASWSFPPRETVRAQLDEYLSSRQLDELSQAKIDAIWSVEGDAGGPLECLDDVVTTCALADPAARELVDFCRQPATLGPIPEFDILQQPDASPAIVVNNLRLYFARWLAQHSYYDEAMKQLEGLSTEDVVDPAALLFYRCTSHHRLLNKQECLDAAQKLLEREEQLPKRYATLALLIRADLEPLKEDSLDEVSRLMDEVKRRLQLRRAGKRVRDQEDEIIAKLDKMIKKLEEQQQQQQQQAANAGNIQPNKPAEDSIRAGGKGAGRVDSKQIGNRSGWGNLPPKERQETLQQIGKDLPAHYREVIEEYFRKLARDGGSAP
jgi:hypothetical protein